MVQGDLRFAVLAGLMAASASGFGKMGLDGSQTASLTATYLPSLSQYHDEIALAMRTISFLMILACNAMQINFSAKCLDQSSSVVAVVTITGLNFFFSALLGWICFGEHLQALWFVGAFFIVIGLYCIHSGASPPKEETKQKKT